MGTEVEVLGDSVKNLVGVAGQVNAVKAQHRMKVVNAGRAPVRNLGLDGMADLIAQ